MCKEHGLSIKDLAIKIGISNPSLYGCLKNNSITISVLEKICEALDVTPNYFFEVDTQSDIHNLQGNDNILKNETEFLRQQLKDKEETILALKELVELYKKR